MIEQVIPCPTCPEGWRPLDKEHCADCYEGQIERLRNALREIAELYQGVHVYRAVQIARAALSNGEHS